MAGPSDNSPSQENTGVMERSRYVTAGDQPNAALAREELRRDAIRETLLAAARKEYPTLLNGVQTGYSADLEGLQRNVNAYLKSEGNRLHSRVVFIDPAKFDTGMALGLPAAATVSTMLSMQSVQPLQGVVEGAAGKMTSGFATKFGANTYTQDPTAFINAGSPSREACVVVPTSDHAMPDAAAIKGLPDADRIKFLDRHESWHCIDDRYAMRGIKPEDVKDVRITDINSIANNRAACEVLAVQYQKEAFADAGAIGSMIREGYDLSLLDKVSAWRKGRPGDFAHLTTPVLEGLKQEIRDMGGVGEFRKLNEAQAKELYYKAVDNYGVNGRSFQIALKYETATALQKAGYQVDAVFDRDVSRGISFNHYANNTPQAPVPAPLSFAEAAQLGQYDARAQLEQRAFKIGQKITPSTMIRAYTQLQEELRTQMKAHPETQLYAQEMTKLQRDFTTGLKNMDYVEANDRFNVRIENVEPSLAVFSDHPAKQAPKTLKPAIKP